MFETQLGLRENPFLAGHHPKYLFPSRAHRDALVHLRDGLEHREPFILITGDPGTGRTLAVYDALGEWGARAVVALMTQPDLTPDELFEEICLRFGVDAPAPALTSADLGALLAAMHARGDLAILVIDGAEVLDDELLSALERLSLLEVKGESLLRIILVGYPEFESVLARPELQSLDDRIQVRHRMEVLSADETVEYLHHRIAVAGGDPAELFPTDTCFEVFRFAGGVPGEVNHIALQALRLASEEGSRTVTPEHVLAVAEADGLDGAPTENEPMIGHAAPAAPPRAARADTAYDNRTVEQPPAPEPFATPIPPATPRSRRVKAAAEAQPMADASASMPDETTGPILPSWFDDIVARRKQADEQEAVQHPAPPVEVNAASQDEVAATDAVEADAIEADAVEADAVEADAVEADAVEADAVEADAVEADAVEAYDEPIDPAGASPEELLGLVSEAPAADAPAAPIDFVPVWASDRAPDEPTLVADETSIAEAPEQSAPATPPVELYLAAPPEEVVSVPMPPAPPVDFVPELESVPPAVIQAALRQNLNWLAPVAVLAAVVIAALLFIRLTGRTPGTTAPEPEPASSVPRPVGSGAAPRPVATAPKPAAPVKAAPTHVKAAPAPAKVGAPAPAKAGTPTHVKSTATSATPAPAKTVKPAPVKSTVTGKTTVKATVTTKAAPRAIVKTPEPTKPAASATVKPATTPASTAPNGATATALGSTSKPAAGGRALYGIAVGSYLFEDRAKSELATMSDKTHLPSRVIAVSDGGTSMFQVVVGSFTSRAAAETQANALVRTGQANQASVISLPRATPANP